MALSGEQAASLIAAALAAITSVRTLSSAASGVSDFDKIAGTCEDARCFPGACPVSRRASVDGTSKGLSVTDALRAARSDGHAASSTRGTRPAAAAAAAPYGSCPSLTGGLKDKALVAQVPTGAFPRKGSSFATALAPFRRPNGYTALSLAKSESVGSLVTSEDADGAAARGVAAASLSVVSYP